MSVSGVGRKPQPPVKALEPRTLENLFEIAALELMSVLDHVEGEHGVEVVTDPKLRGADSLLGLYTLWRRGEVSLPWLAEQLANTMAKSHRPSGECAAKTKKKATGGH